MQQMRKVRKQLRLYTESRIVIVPAGIGKNPDVRIFLPESQKIGGEISFEQ